jgi:hypothetical protein
MVAIDMCLAKRFGLMGENDYEAALITAFYSSITSMVSLYSDAVILKPPAAKEQGLTYFAKHSLPQWLVIRERHLTDNGSNGLFVGSKVSNRGFVSPLVTTVIDKKHLIYMVSFSLCS